MKTFNLSAAACAVVLSTCAVIAPAQAQNAQVSGALGHYEWQAAQQTGPRAALRAPVRVWVPAAQDVADCDCAMMRAKALDRMSSKAMPGNG